MVRDSQVGRRKVSGGRGLLALFILAVRAGRQAGSIVAAVAHVFLAEKGGQLNRHVTDWQIKTLLVRLFSLQPVNHHRLTPGQPVCLMRHRVDDSFRHPIPINNQLPITNQSTAYT